MRSLLTTTFLSGCFLLLLTPTCWISAPTVGLLPREKLEVRDGRQPMLPVLVVDDVLGLVVAAHFVECSLWHILEAAEEDAGPEDVLTGQLGVEVHLPLLAKGARVPAPGIRVRCPQLRPTSGGRRPVLLLAPDGLDRELCLGKDSS